MEEQEKNETIERDILVPGATGEAQTGGAATTDMDRLTEDIIGAIKTVYDPEIPVDIFELGLIYKIDVSDDKDVTIDMTLTAPGCPVAEYMPQWVIDAVGTVAGLRNVSVEMTFDPPWDPSRMSEEAQLVLNMY